MKTLSFVSFVLIAMAIAAAPARAADDSATLDAHITAVNRTARTPEGRQVVVQRLSKELGIPAKTLQAQRQRTGLGWGELLIANRISQRTGMRFDQVVAEFRGGRGWGEIAHRHDLNVGKLVSDVKTSHAAMQASMSARGHARAGGEKEGITAGGNRRQPGADGGAAAGGEGRMGPGGARGDGLGVTSGVGSPGHGFGGGLRGGGRR